MIYCMQIELELEFKSSGIGISNINKKFSWSEEEIGENFVAKIIANLQNFAQIST